MELTIIIVIVGVIAIVVTLTRAQRSMDLMEATLQQVPDLAGPA